MMNPQWKDSIEKARMDLPCGGLIMVVDFHHSPFSGIKQYLMNHHIRLGGQILPELEKQFITINKEVHTAYGGLWQYMMYVGEKA